MHRHLTPLLLAIVALAACGSDIEVVKPTPPTDLSALQRAYANPSAPVNPTTAREALEQYAEFGGLVDAAGLHDLVEEAIGGSAEGLGEENEEAESGLSVRRQGVSFAGNGYAEVRRVCDGWVEARDDPGFMNLTLTFSPGEASAVNIDPIIWGAFHDCRYQPNGDGDRIFLPTGSSLNVHHGGALSFEGGFGTGDVLLQVMGGFEIGSQTIESDLDFKFGIESGDFEYRFETSEGDLVAIGSVDTPNALRGSNGTWTCQFGEGTCTNVDSGDTFSLR